MAATATAASFGMSFGGAMAGDLVGTGVGTTIGAAMGMPLGGAGMAAGGFLGGMVGGVLGENLGMLGGYAMNPMAPMINRRRDMLRMQGSTRGIVTTGGSLDVSGSGLGYGASTSMAQGMYDMAADSSLFNREDYMKISSLAMQNGMVNMANSPEQILKTVKDVSKTLSVFMSVAGDPDVQSAMARMGDLYQMGVAIPKLTEAQSNIRQFARMAGVSVDEAMSTYGAQGGFMYKQAGLTQGGGVQMGIAGAGISNALIQSGALSQADVNRLGGVSGMGQSLAGSAAGFLGGGSAMMLHGLLSSGPGGNPGIDQAKVQAYLSGKTSMNDLIGDTSIYGGRNGISNVQYVMNNQERLQTQLSDTLGPQGTMAFMLRAMQDLQSTMPGADTQTVANMITGNKDTALILSELAGNPTAMRSMIQEGQREQRRAGMAGHSRWLEENSAWQSNIARPLRQFGAGLGERYFGGLSRGLASWEESSRAEAAGLHLRSNAGAGFGLSSTSGLPNLGGGAPFNEKAHWYSLNRPANSILYRAMGNEGITGALRSVGDMFGWGGMSDENIAAASRSLIGAGDLLAEELTSSQLSSMTGGLNQSQGADVTEKLLATFRTEASKRGKDNAAFTPEMLQMAYKKRDGKALPLSEVRRAWQIGAAVYGSDRHIKTSLDNVRQTSSQLRGLGSEGMTDRQVRGILQSGVEDATGIKLSGRRTLDALGEVNKFAFGQGLFGEKGGMDLISLLGEASMVGAAGADEAQIKLLGTERGSELLKMMRSDEGLNKSIQELYTGSILHRGDKGIGALVGGSRGASSALAMRTLADTLQNQGVNVDEFRKDYSLKSLRGLEGLQGRLTGKSDDYVRNWIGGVIGGASATEHVGGAMGPDGMRVSTDLALSSFAASADTSSKSMGEHVKTLGQHVEEFGVAVQEMRSKGE